VAAAIESQGLTRKFGDLVAVSELNLKIEAGEVFGFLGPNGSGKTTTVRLLNCLLRPTSGWAKVMGFDIADDPTEIRRRTGVLTETAALYENLSAADNLRFFGELYGLYGEGLSKKIDELLEFFGLAGRRGDRVGSFSTGMRKRLAIARSLIHDPPVLFLDEPTSGLDPEAARLVRDHIAELSRGEKRTVFLCTHNLDEAQRLCSRVAVIENGRVIASGSPQELEKRLWKGTWVEVNLEAVSDSLVAKIESLGLVRSLKRDGRVISVQVDSPSQIPDLVAEVVGAGGRIRAVNEVAHSLEEIYFRLRSEDVNGHEAGAGHRP